MTPLELFTNDVILIYYFESVVILIALLFIFLANKIFAFFQKLGSKRFFLLYLLSLTSSFLGTTLGLFIGLSHSPVVGAFIPALLSFISGISIYLYIKKDTPISSQNQIIASTNILLISFFLIIGSLKGSEIRINVEDENKHREFIYNLREKEFIHKLTNDKNDSSNVEIINFDDLKRELEDKATNRVDGRRP